MKHFFTLFIFVIICYNIKMVTMLAKWLIKQSNNVSDSKVRKAYGLLCSIIGIALNLILFALKFIAGSISGSIAITADAFNNLSDAGSSIITMFGFIVAGHQADSDHPFGHGRFEYISGVFVSMLILLMGFELLKSSVEKIISPVDVVTTPLVFIILGISIAVKLYMAFYNHRIGNRIDSAAMKATAIDSLSDMVSTSVVLICSLLTLLFKIRIDAYCGLLVSVFIFYSGIKSAKDTISPLLGQPPKKEFVDEVTSIVLSHEQVCGIHDLIVHDYGPNRCMLSLHAEVPAHADILEMHDLIDNIERDLCERFNCVATIHMDPIVTNDEISNELHQRVCELVSSIDPHLTIHDFRMVAGPTHTNLVFDVVVPHKFKYSDKELKDLIGDKIAQFDGNYYAVIDVDKEYLK